MNRSMLIRALRAVALGASLPASLLAQAAKPASAEKELPLKYAGPPTKPEITAGDLMTRLYIYADDSLMGRRFGTEYNAKATAYIEREVRRLGLVPAGDSGGYFQNLPVFVRGLDTAKTVFSVDGTPLKPGVDFLIQTAGKPHSIPSTPAVYLGMQYDTLDIPSPDAVRGKVVVVRPFFPGPGFNGQQFVATNGFQAYQRMLAAAMVVVGVSGDQLNPAAVRAALAPTGARMLSDEETQLQVGITTKAAEAIFGGPLTGVAKGTTGKSVVIEPHFIDTPRLARNVVAILPGSDPKLKGQYVAIGAHNDHIGTRPTAVDHDSVKVFMQLVRPQGADNPPVPATAEQVARIRQLTDSLHAVHGGPRPDSIFNGADDDGSGTVTVLEIAEAFAAAKTKPKRSLLFVWHTGEEAGLFGSEWFTDHPTIPRDSIVAQLNMDMVGRGRATDATGEDKAGELLHGGPGYLQLIGSRRLSTELGDLMEAVNKDMKLDFHFDYGMDANGHPQNIYCRSDHYEYARYGIPIVFITTGGHADYHQVTDEPQYIDYPHMAQIGTLVYDAALRVANLDHRVVVDKPKPDPKGNCVQ
jgi:hypothetical protein